MGNNSISIRNISILQHTFITTILHGISYIYTTHAILATINLRSGKRKHLTKSFETTLNNIYIYIYIYIYIIYYYILLYIIIIYNNNI